MALGGEEIEEGLANVGNTHYGLGHVWASLGLMAKKWLDTGRLGA
jgi:hypothetical protein